jgi:methionyl-tRNA synthetase
LKALLFNRRKQERLTSITLDGMWHLFRVHLIVAGFMDTMGSDEYLTFISSWFCLRNKVKEYWEKMMAKKYLVTPALPYANGSIHLGHLVEHIQVNVFVRALRMSGEKVLYVCGGDSHGTPIELNAQKSQMKPEAFVAKWNAAHSKSLAAFGVEFDGGYGTTHTPENEKHAGLIFAAAKAADHIYVKEVEQLFDEKAGRFLPDRMVRGTCPKCKADDQYGDACEACGTTYSPRDLKNPKSAISGTKPVFKSSDHYFFKLGDYADRLQAWTKKPGAVASDVQTYLQRWFDDGLRDWDISRDGPYFGFKIPGEENKYFYVWLDAPIGYISLSERAAALQGESWEQYWRDEDVEIYHFIGKDIIYFHTLFWPALLMSAGYNLPTTVAVHGMLTVDGKKMSKSRGTFINADTYAEFLEPEALRYYLCCKLNAKVEDIDLNLEDFVLRVNADLINKVVNLLSRSVPMLHRYYGGTLASLDPAAQEMLATIETIAHGVEAKYRARNFSHVVRDAVEIADLANRYVQESEPWKGVKNNPELAHTQLTTALHTGKICVGLLKPILPKMAQECEKMLHMAEDGFRFSDLTKALPVGSKIRSYPRLFERVDPKQIQKMSEASKQDTNEKKAEKQPKASSAKATSTPKNPHVIDFDTFTQIDLRAAKVLECSDVEGAEKLLKILLDVGDLGQRQVFSGLKPHVSADQLQGQMVVLVANLAARKMRFGMSEGMILAAGDDVPRPVFVPGAQPGDRVR